MNVDKKIKELEKASRRSRMAIPVVGCFLLFIVAVIWLLNKYINIPTWLSIIVIGMTAFGFIGDVINYFYCDWKLKFLRHETGEE
ncbi:MAG: hypothetical protein GWN67_07860 [Phycisphaerae bacterium]|nr:hypothetical protein [Phycisphaerae bacterium]NIP53748.1 hypothetical protein [Phycisphaerae bacterium]NIS51044.1 hypothetical protein [Phycisphaerae bacterium]NIU10966.1 hypothetical protein [Phycisphaerae bacterium]NIU56290.1 hypothetical protein [Phycisphaerae bacterium]